MRVVPFEPDHLRRLDPREMEARLFAAIPSDLDAYARAMDQPGLSFTGLADDGTVIGCAGVRPLWRGVGQAWALLSVHAPHAFKAVHRAALAGLADAFATGGFHRVQISVAVDFPAGLRWAGRLGFEVEGRMRRYGMTGDDHYLMARTA